MARHTPLRVDVKYNHFAFLLHSIMESVLGVDEPWEGFHHRTAINEGFAIHHEAGLNLLHFLYFLHENIFTQTFFILLTSRCHEDFRVIQIKIFYYLKKYLSKC